MTKGDRDKLRAELAGKAMQGILSRDELLGIIELSQGTIEENVARGAVKYADALMAELGIRYDGQSYDRRDYPDGMEG